MAKRSIQPEDYFRMQFLAGGRLAPDGAKVVYSIKHVETDGDDEKEYTTLWLHDLDSGETRQLTSGKTDDNAPAWSPDGKQIAFTRKRGEEQPQIFLLPVDGGEARQLTDFEQGVAGGAVFSPDGTQLAFSVGRADDDKPDIEKPYRVTRHVYRFDRLGYIDTVVNDIYVMAVAGGEPKQLTDDDTLNGNLKWSPDGSEILYDALMKPDVHRAISPRIRIVNMDGVVREVVGDWGSANAANWLPDGKRIVFTGRPDDGRPIGSKSDVYVVGAQGGEPENRSAGLKVGVEGGVGGWMPGRDVRAARIIAAPDGKSVYAHVQEGGTKHIYRVGVEGPEQCQPVVTGERACFLLGVHQDSGRVLYAATAFNETPQLFVAEADGSGERRITAINDDFLADIALPTVERLLFPGVDGVQVEGWALTPQAANGPFPTVMLIHGGPHSAYGSSFHFLAQMFVGAGYAVLMFNHRASTGYGDEFSTAIKGDWGNLDYNDLLAGVDYAIDKGIADPDRIGITGVSGGGNLSSWIVGQTDRFKAAAPCNPLTNWQSFYGVSDIGVWFSVEQLGGHPHEIPEVYDRCSPITYAHNCTTPTLMIQTEYDHRCPPEQSEQFYAVLKANGCTVEMLRIPKAPHGGAMDGDPINRRVYNQAVLDWMNQYVRGMAPESV